MKDAILTVTLNPALDKLIIPSREVTSAGGKGINVSRVLKRLGIKVLATGIAGGSTGQEILRLLKGEGIKNDFVVIPEESRINITVKDQKTQGQFRVMGRGPYIDKNTLREFVHKYISLLGSSSWVTLNGRNAEGVPHHFYAKLIRLAKRKRVNTVLDASGPDFSEGLKARPFLIKPNLEEAQEALGKSLSSMRNIKKSLMEFQKRGMAMVLLTLAEEGAVGIFKDELWHCRPPRVKITHDIGCGDAFLGGFLAAFLRGHSFSQALKFAVGCGTSNAQAMIPGKIDGKKALRLSQDIKIRKF